MSIPVPLISYISAILARLSYFDNDKFLLKYNDIFNIPELKKQLEPLKKINEQNIFDKDVQNMSDITKKVNSFLHSVSKNETHNEIQNNNNNDLTKNMKYICISNSNYSSVYIVRDPVLKTIFVAFRGTYSLKSARSYLKVTSIKPFITCKNDKNKGVLLGIFKIVGEIFYTIQESIRYLSEGHNYKIICTGHSLGGAGAHIFSYLYTKQLLDKKSGIYNNNKQIVCITFGAPRIMNLSLIEEYNTLIEEKHILFRRYITNGDVFPLLPFTRKNGNNSYYHIEEQNEAFEKYVFSCVNYKKTNKVKCNYKNKTKKIKPSPKYHAMYLGISFTGAAQDLTNIKKEIKREDYTNDTICRINIGGNNQPYKIVFFNLQKAKIPDSNILTKLKKYILTDYKHQDIYITQKMFHNLIENSTVIDDMNNLNIQKYTSLVPIQKKEKNKELFCFE
jgi:hypothetical protein